MDGNRRSWIDRSAFVSTIRIACYGQMPALQYSTIKHSTYLGESELISLESSLALGDVRELSWCHGADRGAPCSRLRPVVLVSRHTPAAHLTGGLSSNDTVRAECACCCDDARGDARESGLVCGSYV
jgi:hypothetical protein